MSFVISFWKRVRLERKLPESITCPFSNNFKMILYTTGSAMSSGSYANIKLTENPSLTVIQGPNLHMPSNR